MFHAARTEREPVLRADRPWEGRSAITGPYVYGTVFWEDGRLRMWYQVLYKGVHVAYAESTDGRVWHKPELGLIEFGGSAANNLVVSAFAPAVCGGLCHNPSVLCRPNRGEAHECYVLYGFDPAAGHPRVAYSADGLRWRYHAATENKPLFTSGDVVQVFEDVYQGRVVATWKTRNRRGRAVGVAWSEDGRTWTKVWEGPVFGADDLDPDATQIYGMPVFPYQGLYIGLPWVYHARYFRYGNYSIPRVHEAQEDSPRTMEPQLAWSWDLVNWTRPPDRCAFIPRGRRGAWDADMIVTARAPVVADNELWFYYGGFEGVHDAPRVRAAIGRAILRLDGFCSMHAGASEGWLVTRREPMLGPGVLLNARTASDGYVAAEILDRRNRVVTGFERGDGVPFCGDAVAHRWQWKGANRLPQGSDFKFRFWLRNADLYSYFPVDLDPAQTDLARF